MMRLPRTPGMNVLSVLIASVLLALVAVGFLRVFQNMTKGSQFITQKGEINDLFNSVRMVLTSPDLCKCNLAGTTFPAASAATHTINLTGLKMYSAIGCTPGAQLVTVTSAPKPTYWVTGLTVRQFSMINSTSYAAKLRVQLQKPPGSLGGTTDTQDFDVLYQTSTAGGTVTLNGCQGASGVGGGSGSGSGSGGGSGSGSGTGGGSNVGKFQVSCTVDICVRMNTTDGSASCSRGTNLGGSWMWTSCGTPFAASTSGPEGQYQLACFAAYQCTRTDTTTGASVCAMGTMAGSWMWTYCGAP